MQSDIPCIFNIKNSQYKSTNTDKHTPIYSLPEGKQPGQMRAARGRRLHPENNLSNEKIQMFDIRLFHDKNVRFQLQ